MFHWLILLFRLFLLFHPATGILTPSLDWPARLLVFEHKNCEGNDSVIRLARRERGHCRSKGRQSPQIVCGRRRHEFFNRRLRCFGPATRPRWPRSSFPTVSRFPSVATGLPDTVALCS